MPRFLERPPTYDTMITMVTSNGDYTGYTVLVLLFWLLSWRSSCCCGVIPRMVAKFKLFRLLGADLKLPVAAKSVQRHSILERFPNPSGCSQLPSPRRRRQADGVKTLVQQHSSSQKAVAIVENGSKERISTNESSATRIPPIRLASKSLFARSFRYFESVGPGRRTQSPSGAAS